MACGRVGKEGYGCGGSSEKGESSGMGFQGGCIGCWQVPLKDPTALGISMWYWLGVDVTFCTRCSIQLQQRVLCVMAKGLTRPWL